MPSILATEIVQKMYIGYYGRAGDPSGVDYWANRLDGEGGTFTQELLTAFGESPEYTERFGNFSNDELIENLYQQLFNRSVEQGGRDYWAGRLQEGTPLSAIAIEILNGAQNEDADIIANKLAFALDFTEKAGSEFTYDTSYISQAKALLASIDESQSSIDEQLGNLDDDIAILNGPGLVISGNTAHINASKPDISSDRWDAIELWETPKSLTIENENDVINITLEMASLDYQYKPNQIDLGPDYSEQYAFAYFDTEKNGLIDFALTLYPGEDSEDFGYQLPAVGTFYGLQEELQESDLFSELRVEPNGSAIRTDFTDEGGTFSTGSGQYISFPEWDEVFSALVDFDTNTTHFGLHPKKLIDFFDALVETYPSDDPSENRFENSEWKPEYDIMKELSIDDLVYITWNASNIYDNSIAPASDGEFVYSYYGLDVWNDNASAAWALL